MHLKRWLTSLAFIPVLIILLFWSGPHLLPFFAALVCILSLREYYRIVWPDSLQSPLTWSITLTGYIMGPVMVLCAHFLPLPWLLFSFSAALILAGWVCMQHFRADAGITSILAMHALAMIYIPLSLAGYMLLFHTDLGGRWIFLILFVVSIGDAGAYYVGSHLGRRKLCPRVSPGKTVEGSMGGLVANIVAGMAVSIFLLPTLVSIKGVIFFIALGVAGQLGDLFESMLKRSAGVKDSGHLLPGHGGLLDRVDAMLFAGPVAMVMILYFL
jgi:phosphatidate cytidylyltransferase